MSAIIRALAQLPLSLHDNAALTLGAAALVSILSWRLWRFTIRPSFYPDAPRELPYWIPFIGHLGSFFADFNGAVTSGIKRFNYTREPFAVTLAGMTMYIISDARDVADIYRDPKSFSREPLTKDLYRMIGLPQTVIDRLFTVNPEARYNLKNPKALHPTDMMMEIYRQHISPGSSLDAFLDGEVTPQIRKSLDPDTLVPLSLDPGARATVSLHDLCADVFVKGIAEAYYGDVIWQIQPDFVKWYLLWDKVNWKFTFGLPGIFSRDMLAAKRVLTETFVRYFALSQEERGHSNFFVQALESSLRDTDLDNEEIARLFMLQTWAILGNMFKTTFWLVAHIAHDPALMESISSEIQPAIRHNKIDHAYLMDECPKLDSLYNEVLRLTMTSPMVRDILSTSTIGGRTLEQGNKVMIVYRQLHLNSDVWGPTPETLHAERFLQDKPLKSNIAYRPWGGGKHVCPGRFLARTATFIFVAFLLGQFDVEVDSDSEKRDSKAFPRADFSKPTPGIVSIADGEDVMLSLRRRV